MQLSGTINVTGYKYAYKLANSGKGKKLRFAGRREIKVKKNILYTVIMLTLCISNGSSTQAKEQGREMQVWQKESVPYTERRQKEDIQVEVMRTEDRLTVAIPEYPVSEKKLNQWLEKYYELKAEEERNFYGYDIEEGDVYKSAKDRKEEGWYQNVHIQPERADDAVISLYEETYYYMGGIHGFSEAAAYNFDSRSGDEITLSMLLKKVELFYDFAGQFLSKMYGVEEEKKENIIENLNNQGRSWYLSEQGITLLGYSGNVSQPAQFCIPYEYAADYIEDKYLPVTKKAAVDCYMIPITIRKQKENKEADTLIFCHKNIAYMDINGDNIADVIECLWEEGKTRLRADINGEVTYIRLNVKGTGLEEMEGAIDVCTVTILRNEKGESAMEITLYKYNGRYDKQTKVTYLYDIVEEKPVFNKIVNGLLNSLKNTV